MSTAGLWLEQIEDLPISERGFVLVRLVEAEFRDWLQMELSEVLPHDESFFALGLTSLGTVEIRERLEAGLGRRIDSSMLYNKPTIGQLVTYLRGDLLADLFERGVAHCPVSPRVEDNALREVVDDLLESLYRS